MKGKIAKYLFISILILFTSGCINFCDEDSTKIVGTIVDFETKNVGTFGNSYECTVVLDTGDKIYI